MKIREIIVVEGKSDTEKIKQAVDADTLETNGSEISIETLKRIQVAQERRGVIVFTDPDYPGERIRKIISSSIPGVKHAFLMKKDAKAKNGKGVGIEHASIEAVREALLSVREEMPDEKETIPWEVLVGLQLIGGGNARNLREQLGNALNIGYMNGKQLYKRLNMFQITLEELEQAVHQIKEEETNE